MIYKFVFSLRGRYFPADIFGLLIFVVCTVMGVFCLSAKSEISWRVVILPTPVSNAIEAQCRHAGGRGGGGLVA